MIAVAPTLVVAGSAVISAASAKAASVVPAVQRAADYATAQRVRTAVAVLDTRTGKTYSAGLSSSWFPSASTVKPYMAVYLLRTGQMSGDDEKQAWRMITRSSNSAFEHLLCEHFRCSATRLFYWMRGHYWFPEMGGPPSATRPWCWGDTHVTANGITQLYRKVAKDPMVGPWLTNAMSHYVPIVDGFNQAFGIPQAAPHAAIKQGWSDGCSPEAPYHTVLNSTGIVTGRFTVAILTESRNSIAWQRKIITHMAELILPGGEFADAVPWIDSASRSTAPTHGGWRLTVQGSAFRHVQAVMFGDVAGRNVTIASTHLLRVTVPSHSPGWVHIRVVTSHGTSPSTSATRLRFIAPPSVRSISPAVGKTAGGSAVTVTGRRFLHVTTVLIAGQPAQSIQVARSSTSLTAVTPMHAAGTVDVRVVTVYGTSPKTSHDRYLFDDPQPEIAQAQAATTGGGSIELTWSNPTNAAYTGVRICRATDATPQTPSCPALATIAAPASTFTDAAVVTGTTYFYTIFAYDDFGQYSPIGTRVEATA